MDVLGRVAAALAVALLGLCAACGTSSPGGGPSSPSLGAASTPADIVLSTPVKHVTVGDMTVAYRTIGPLSAEADRPARTLVMLMGFSGVMDLWSPRFVESLAQDRELVLFDNRGMGGTDNPMGPYPFSQLADDTAGLVSALGYDRVDVLGWSMGGDVAVDLTVRHPDVVDQLIVYAGDAGGTLAVPPGKKALAALLDTSGTPEERGRRLLELLFPKSWWDEHPDGWKSFPVPREQTTAEAVDLQARATAEWSGVWADLKTIDVPTLFATGTEDVLTPPRNATMMASRVPGSWLVRYEGAGHGLMYQYPERFAETILTFLSVTSLEGS